MFFNKGDYFNQGTFFDWREEDFIDGCERAIKRHEISQVNEEGIALQKNFTYKGMVDRILEELKKI